MSTWRDIWKDSLVANREMSLRQNNDESAFADLATTYEKEKKDGMIRYAYAEALEYRNEKQRALKEYIAARDLFPVQHWKDVASKTIERVSKNQSADEFFDKNDFTSYLWYTFQKVYEFVYLDDFVRYVCLSAISRADSEWPLSLVDFRSVLELQIKTTFPKIVKPYIENKSFSLSSIINELKEKRIIDEDIASAMHKIRIAGNAATHEMKTYDKDDFDNLSNLLKILLFFNKYNKEHNINIPD